MQITKLFIRESWKDQGQKWRCPKANVMEVPMLEGTKNQGM